MVTGGLGDVQLLSLERDSLGSSFYGSFKGSKMFQMVLHVCFISLKGVCIVCQGLWHFERGHMTLKGCHMSLKALFSY